MAFPKRKPSLDWAWEPPVQKPTYVAGQGLEYIVGVDPGMGESSHVFLPSDFWENTLQNRGRVHQREWQNLYQGVPVPLEVEADEIHRRVSARYKVDTKVGKRTYEMLDAKRPKNRRGRGSH